MYKQLQWLYDRQYLLFMLALYLLLGAPQCCCNNKFMSTQQIYLVSYRTNEPKKGEIIQYYRTARQIFKCQQDKTCNLKCQADEYYNSLQ